MHMQRYQRVWQVIGEASVVAAYLGMVKDESNKVKITEGGGIEKTWRNQKQRSENTLLILRNSILRLVNAWVFPIGS